MSGGSVTRAEPWEQQIPYLERGMSEAWRLYDETLRGGAPQYYQGPTLAGFTPSQQISQRGILGYGLGPRPQVMQGAAETALVRGLSGAVNTSVLDPMVESYRTQMMRDLQGKTLPALRESIVKYQPGGSTRANMIQSNAIAAAQENLQNNVAQLYGGAYQQAQQQVPNFQQLYPSIMGAPIGLMNEVGGVGADHRALVQEAINRDQARWNFEQNRGQQALANYMGGIYGDFGGTVTNQPSMLQQLGSIAGIIGNLPGVPFS